MGEKVYNPMLAYEALLNDYACKDADAIRLHGKVSPDIRPNYFRDTDRIMNSDAYTRYMYKTQVYSNLTNDNVSTRGVHVQLVYRAAKCIGEMLGLNIELIEAMAKGHDIGHVPYGHLGERYLNELSLLYDHTYFMHNVQSVRALNVLERQGEGLNLTIQVLDGILCHNGEIVENKYQPVFKTKEDFIRDYEQCYVDGNHSKELKPMTLEGCVVRISDVIAYLGRDIEDAIKLNKLNIDEIPESIKKILGNKNGDIMNTIINDIIINSTGKPYIALSSEIFQAIEDLKKFNYEHIYSKSMTDEEKGKVKDMFNLLFETYLQDLRVDNKESPIYIDFLDKMIPKYIEETSDKRKVIDYIACMTDNYMNRQAELVRTRKKTVR